LLGPKETPAEGYGYYWNKSLNSIENFMVVWENFQLRLPK